MAMAAAGSVQASNPNTVTAVNRFSADIGESLTLNYRFAPRTLHIDHGATLTFREGTPPFPEALEAHTLSIVDRADLPRTLRELFFCDACGPILEANDPDHPVIRARVTAPAGTTLNYLCSIHSWMQGKLVVE
jgi:hypothetical protein